MKYYNFSQLLVVTFSENATLSLLSMFSGCLISSLIFLPEIRIANLHIPNEKVM